jgi:hypothetical protein
MVVDRYFEEVLNGHDLAALEELVEDETLKQRIRRDKVGPTRAWRIER